MNSATAGGLWPAAWLNVSNERLRRTLPEILTEGTEAEETIRRVRQCQCNPTGGMFSVTEKWRAKEEEQTHHRSLFLDAWSSARKRDSCGNRRDQTLLCLE